MDLPELECLRQFVSQIPFSKILYQPQYIYSPLLRESSKKARFSANEPCGINVKQLNISLSEGAFSWNELLK